MCALSGSRLGEKELTLHVFYRAHGRIGQEESTVLDAPCAPTQVAVQPPTFVLFVNDPELMHFSYKRYLENQLRHTFGFEGTPIRLYIRRREDKNA